MTTTPNAWVGCLGCYNNADLNGGWLDGTVASDEMGKAVRLTTRPDSLSPNVNVTICARCGSDEFWVFDHENYGGWLKGECSPMEAQRIAELIAAIEADEDVSLAHVTAWNVACEIDVDEWDAPTKMAFQDAFRGEWESFSDYAYEQVTEDEGFGKISEHLRGYFNHDAYARDLAHDYTVVDLTKPDESRVVLVFTNA